VAQPGPPVAPAPYCIQVSTSNYQIMGSSNMPGTTRASCLLYCEQLGPFYTFTAIQGDFCQCFYTTEWVALEAISVVVPNGECDLPCSGDATKMCGGPTPAVLLSVLEVNSQNVLGEAAPWVAPVPPLVNASLGYATYPTNCVISPTSNINPSDAYQGSFGMTIAMCQTSTCASWPYAIVGNNGGYLGQSVCYCFSSSDWATFIGSAHYLLNSQCNAPCSGATTTFCGGWNGNTGNVWTIVKNAGQSVLALAAENNAVSDYTGGGLSIGTIVGIVVGSVVGVLLLVAIVVVVRWKRRGEEHY